jgi:hypothetical protein
MKRHLMYAICGAFLATSVYGSELAGHWKHEKQPVWISIKASETEASGTVVRHDGHDNNVGRLLLKDFTRNHTTSDNWDGQVFAARLGEYKDATIEFAEASQFTMIVKVGFITRKVTWLRVEEPVNP